MQRSTAFLIMLSLSVWCACKKPESTVLCTTDFVTVKLTVTESAGKLITAQSVSAVNTRTGQALEVSKYSDFLKSHEVYVIASDGNKSSFSRKGDKVIVTVIHPDGRQKTAEFVLANGECHLGKISGPEIIAFE